MGTSLERTQFNQVPALVARPEGAPSPLPSVIWFHGWGADKETHQGELERFVAAGFLAVGIDCAGHGQRRMPELETRVAQGRAAGDPLFCELVAQTVGEVPSLIDILIQRGVSDPQRIGLAGVSMGACIVYGAVVAERRIRGAVALLGSPEWNSADNPHRDIDRFYPTALLSITAERDDVVSPVAARRLHNALGRLYASQPERLAYREIAAAAHFLEPEEWSAAIDEASAWLQRFAR